MTVVSKKGARSSSRARRAVSAGPRLWPWRGTGWFVFGGVRTVRDLAKLAASAGAVGLGDLVQPILLDVTDSAQIAAAQELVALTLRERGLRLTGLINNAGIAVGGPLEEVPLARLREILAINVIGVVAVTQAFLPLLRAGRGRIINISSVSGRVAAPFLGPYAASKFALEALSDALRVELRPWGVPVMPDRARPDQHADLGEDDSCCRR